MNYVISIINPEALGALTEICEKLSLPLTVTLHGARNRPMQGMLDLLGIESNEKRVVLTVANEEKTAQLIAAQRRYLHLGRAGARVCDRYTDKKRWRRKSRGIHERRYKERKIHTGNKIRL